MALNARHIPVTRDHVQKWLDAYDARFSDDTQLKDWLQRRIDARLLPDTNVDTSSRDDFEADSTPLIDMLMADLDSYARHR